mgnify:CR=1 FL=1|jgi:hypothetical protein
MSKKPTASKNPAAIALTAELIRRAWEVDGELLDNDAQTAAVVFLETRDDGTREPLRAIIYEIDMKTYHRIPGRPIAEICRNDSTDEEFQAMVRRAAGFAPAPRRTWPKQ